MDHFIKLPRFLTVNSACTSLSWAELKFKKTVQNYIYAHYYFAGGSVCPSAMRFCQGVNTDSVNCHVSLLSGSSLFWRLQVEEGSYMKLVEFSE